MATNILSSPEDFGTTWSNNNGAVSSNLNATTAPDGTTTADRHIDNAATGTAAVYLAQGVGVATSTAHTMSVFAKQDQLSFLVISLIGFTTPSNSHTWFDLANGQVGTSDAAHTASIIDTGDGWYRSIITFTTDAVDTAGEIRLYVDDVDNGGRTVPLDGTSSIFVWGAYLHEGSEAELYTSEAGVTIGASSGGRSGVGLSFGKMGGMGHG